MNKHLSHTKVTDALRVQNGLTTNDILSTPVNTPVLVYCPEIDMWDGVHRLQRVDGEDCYVLLPPPSDLTKFHSTVVERNLQSENKTRGDRVLLERSEPHASRPNTPISCLTTFPGRAENTENISNSFQKQYANDRTNSALKMKISGSYNINRNDIIKFFKKQGISQSTDYMIWEASRNM